MNWVKIATRKQSLIESHAKIIGWNKGICKELGCRQVRLFFESKEGHLTFYFNNNDLIELKEKLSDILNDREQELILRNNGFNHSMDMIEYTKTFAKIDFSRKTNDELLNYYAKFVKLQVDITPFIVLPTFVDEVLVPQVRHILSKRNLSEREIEDYLRILVSMREESYASKEEKEFLQIALKNFGDVKPLIKKHTEEYCWIPIQAEEQPWNERYFSGLLKEVRRDREKYKERLVYLENYVRNIGQEKQKVLEAVKPTQKELYLLRVLEDWAYAKDFRREMLSRYRFYSRNLFREIGKRLGLSGLAVRNLLLVEVKEGLIRGRLDRDEISKRMDYYVLNNIDGKINVFVGERAKKVYKEEILKDEVENVEVLRGYGASPGKITGVARLVWGILDMNKFNEGDILVARMTTPDIVPMMKKAGAIITDEGGMLSHAAIVCREMKIPCIVGTNIATEVFRDGDIVEVDAHNGIIKKMIDG